MKEKLLLLLLALFLCKEWLNAFPMLEEAKEQLVVERTIREGPRVPSLNTMLGSSRIAQGEISEMPLSEKRESKPFVSWDPLRRSQSQLRGTKVNIVSGGSLRGRRAPVLPCINHVISKQKIQEECSPSAAPMKQDEKEKLHQSIEYIALISDYARALAADELAGELTRIIEESGEASILEHDLKELSQARENVFSALACSELVPLEVTKFLLEEAAANLGKTLDQLSEKYVRDSVDDVDSARAEEYSI